MNEEKSPIACIVIWYNPNSEDVEKALKSYYDKVKQVIIVDNSKSNQTITNQQILNKFPRIKYIALGENKGIAYALNKGFEEAKKLGFEYALTLDQDSSADETMISKLYQAAQTLNATTIQYGIIAAQPDTPQRKKRVTAGISEMESVITSGNLVNIKAYNHIGGFKDALFIDYVDCWFSLAMRKHGYKICQVNEAVLFHNLGNISHKSFMGIKMFPTNHSPLRHYYISRNRQYLMREFSNDFPEFIKWEKSNYLKIIIKIILFEKNKVSKLKAAYRGFCDFKRHHTGPM